MAQAHALIPSETGQRSRMNQDSCANMWVVIEQDVHPTHKTMKVVGIPVSHFAIEMPDTPTAVIFHG